MTGLLTINDILGPDGLIAARLKSYEQRPQQIEMAEAVGQAIQKRQHLIIEAGTGVGKSFAYLVPAVLAATEPESEGLSSEPTRPKRIVISTHTISLQEQLMQKDIPLLNSVVPREFTAVLAKGRSNYLSLRRLASTGERAASLFTDDNEIDQLRDLRSWVRETGDGSKSDLMFDVLPVVWDEVSSDSSNCMGRNCPTYKDCFYYRARSRVEHAQIIVVNHALFFSDLALRRANVSILPDYDAVILDEAHTLEAVAADHLGISVTSGQVRYILNRLFNDRTNKGLFVSGGHKQAQKETIECHIAADDFFDEAYQWYLAQTSKSGKGNNGRIRQAEVLRNHLTAVLGKLAVTTRRIASTIEDPTKRQDFTAAHNRLEVLADSVNAWNKQALSDMVYWVEGYQRGRSQPRVSLRAAPVDVGPTLREELFQQVPSVIMTSATLGVGNNQSFDFFRSRIGLTQSTAQQLGSPFDYEKQARLVLVKGMPDPQKQAEEFRRHMVEQIKRYVDQTDGHAFVLFTSYSMLRFAQQALTPWLADRQLALYSQGDGIPRSEMIRRFKENPFAVLLGTESFWHGVDVPGDALQNVIIPKLPFSVPDQPLLEARLERIEESGGNPFADYSLPSAVIRFRQGFGRLIRTQQDYGMVVVLDPRVYTRRYGRVFIDSLPTCQIIEESVQQSFE